VERELAVAREIQNCRRRERFCQGADAVDCLRLRERARPEFAPAEAALVENLALVRNADGKSGDVLRAHNQADGIVDGRAAEQHGEKQGLHAGFFAAAPGRSARAQAAMFLTL